MKNKVPAHVAKGILARVPLQFSFWLCTNENLRSIEDISKALVKASDDVFRYHVNRDKNDFEAWIRDVIKDKDLAREIARVKTKETLIRKISERIEILRSAIKRNGPGKSRRKMPSKQRRGRRRQRKARRARRPKRPYRRMRNRRGRRRQQRHQ